MTDTHIIEAPWSVDQVLKLNEFQDCPWVHPFTCINRDDGKHEEDAVLVATLGGWICPYCKHTQNWAHDFMFGGAPPNPITKLFDHKQEG